MKIKRISKRRKKSVKFLRSDSFSLLVKRVAFGSDIFYRDIEAVFQFVNCDSKGHIRRVVHYGKKLLFCHYRMLVFDQLTKNFELNLSDCLWMSIYFYDVVFWIELDGAVL